MAGQDAQDRNLPASDRKISRAREDGQVPRSRDLGHMLAMAVGIGLLVAIAPMLMDWLQQLLKTALRFDARVLEQPGIMLDRVQDLALRMLVVVIPMGVLMALVGVAGALLVGGWNFSLKAIEPKFDKFNPITGFGRLFSGSQLIQTLKACGLAVLLGGVALLYLVQQWGTFSGLIEVALPAAISSLGSTLLGGMLLMLLVLTLFAAVDAPLQKFLYLKQLRMSVQEMKQEFKEQEGSPEVKGKLKARMREMSRRRMLAAVPTADLVVMNPTHYAVALKYDEHSMGAPRVVAKGADLVAMTIRDTATKAKVPVLQAPVLARALYAHAKLDKEIPAALFAAVAQVLAYVYQLRAALAGKAPMPGELPALKVPPELDPHEKNAVAPTAKDEV
jgi:flagellar biosynthetic protein FlhB